MVGKEKYYSSNFELRARKAAVRKRIKKLEEMGVIRGYTIEVDPKKLGYELVCFVGLDVSPEKYMKLLTISRTSRRW